MARASSPEPSPSAASGSVGRSVRRFGLRARILFALCLAFLISSALLGFAVVQLAERAREVDRLRAAHATARGLAVVVAVDAQLALREAEALVVDGAIGGVEVVDRRGVRLSRGELRHGARVEAPVAGGGIVRLSVRRPAGGAASLAPLFALYMLVTAGTVLVFTYIALGQLIVRPVERLTRASERLAAGGAHVSVPEEGAAEVARLASAFNDMAAQLRAERAALEARLTELERATKELHTAQDSLVRSEKLASVGRLAAGVAHEIGNPLAAILGFVELLRAGGLDPEEEREFLARIFAETHRIHRIIRDLLDFSRQSSDAEDDARDVSSDLRAVVADAVRLVAPQKDLRLVTIEQQLHDDARPVRGAAHRLTQVVLNLLLNAADAVDGEGTIVVTVMPSEGDTVSLVVEDSGPGIAPGVLATLFEPFVTTKPAGRGTGLGLAVCHTIVERLGGTMRAENTLTADGRASGARFVVRLPVASGQTRA
jgi:signal transduction histidine kinase